MSMEKDPVFEWMSKEPPESNVMIHICQFKISAIHIDLSFKKSSTSKSILNISEQTNLGVASL